LPAALAAAAGAGTAGPNSLFETASHASVLMLGKPMCAVTPLAGVGASSITPMPPRSTRGVSPETSRVYCACTVVPRSKRSVSRLAGPGLPSGSNWVW
jgi:hypothetical protein